MSDKQKYKEFPGDFGPVRVGLNHLNYDNAKHSIYISSGSNPGPTAISRDDALKLADHLRDLVATFDALKPKEKTAVEKVAELEPGTVFTAGREEKKYVKLNGDKVHSVNFGMTLVPKNFEFVKGIEILYDPEA